VADEVTGTYLNGYKFRSTKTVMAQMGMPAMFFRYELSPIKVRYVYTHKTFLEYFMVILSIVGGIFTVAAILESLFLQAFSVVAPGEKVNQH